MASQGSGAGAKRAQLKFGECYVRRAGRQLIALIYAEAERALCRLVKCFLVHQRDAGLRAPYITQLV